MSNLKVYKTIKEQLYYLDKCKNIEIDKECECLFDQRNYTSIINPYKCFFHTGKAQDGSHLYRRRIDFGEYLYLLKVEQAWSNRIFIHLSVFERKFKHVLFQNFCLAYVHDGDDCCITYFDELKQVVDDPKVGICKIFPNINLVLTKNGYQPKQWGVEINLKVINKMIEAGRSSLDTPNHTKTNILVNHYQKNENTVPLWVIPNILSFGELIILFEMASFKTCRKVMSIMFEIDEDKITMKDIFKFKGQLEVMRKMRNSISHFEPIFPLFEKEIQKRKHIDTSQMFKTLSILQQVYKTTFDFEKVNLQKPKVSAYNDRVLAILIKIEEYIK